MKKFYDIIKIGAISVLGIFLVVLMIYNFRGIDYAGIHQEGLMAAIASNEPNTKYKNAMDWLNENAPAGERIFNCNWDDFPKMFFYDQKHSYVYGLDPNYLYTKNPELSKKIPDITGGKIDDPAPVIRDEFGAKYIFSDAKENQDFIAKALASGWCDKVYSDDEAIILKIRDEKGEPPTDTVNNETGNASSETKTN